LDTNKDLELVKETESLKVYKVIKFVR